MFNPVKDFDEIRYFNKTNDLKKWTLFSSGITYSIVTLDLCKSEEIDCQIIVYNAGLIKALTPEQLKTSKFFQEAASLMTAPDSVIADQ